MGGDKHVGESWDLAVPKAPDVDSAFDEDLEETTEASVLRSVVRTAGQWGLYLGLSALFLRSILTTTIVADDFANPFQQLISVGMSPWEMVRYAWRATSSVGHFNYLGQIIGSLYTGGTVWLASEFGIRFSTMYAALKFAMLVGTAVAGSAVLRQVCAYLGSPIDAWRNRILVSAIFFSTLQLHMAWSNDPVGSYPLSGYASAILGLAALGLGINAVRVKRRWTPTLAGLAGTAALLYYEINVAVVGAVGLFAFVNAIAVGRGGRWREGLRLAPAVVIPSVVVVFLQGRASAASANYGGTSVRLEEMVPTFWRSLMSSLPGSAWQLSREFLGFTVALRSNALAILVVVVAVVVTLAAIIQPVPDPPSPPPWKLAAAVAGPVAYWVGATLIQASTAKVQAEAARIGQVYNYYAIGSIVVAMMLALAFHLYVHRVPHLLRPALIVGIAAFVLAQFMLTWNVAEQFNARTPANRNLLVAYTEHWPMEERCEALLRWSEVPWPEYYEVAIIRGMEIGYMRFQGESFCDGFVRPP